MSTPAPNQPQPTLKVLVVEDDRASRLVLRHILAKAGNVEITEAVDGFEAYELLNNGSDIPALCLLDINMPRMDGLELLRQIRANPAQAGMKVCFCSAVRDRALVGQACSIKPDFYVLKPYSPQTILQVVEKVRNASAVPAVLENSQVADTQLKLTPDTDNASLGEFIHKIEDLKAQVSGFMRQDPTGAGHTLEGAKVGAGGMGAARLYEALEQITKDFSPGGQSAGEDVSARPNEDDLGLRAEELMKGMQRIREDFEIVQAMGRRLTEQLAATRPEAAAQAPIPPAQKELSALAIEEAAQIV